MFFSIFFDYHGRKTKSGLGKGPLRSDYENPHPWLLSHREKPQGQPVITSNSSAGDNFACAICFYTLSHIYPTLYINVYAHACMQHIIYYVMMQAIGLMY